MFEISSVKLNTCRRTVFGDLSRVKEIWFEVWLIQTGFYQKARTKKWKPITIERAKDRLYSKKEEFWNESGIEKLNTDAWETFLLDGPLSETESFILALPKGLSNHFSDILDSIVHKKTQLSEAFA